MKQQQERLSMKHKTQRKGEYNILLPAEAQAIVQDLCLCLSLVVKPTNLTTTKK